MRVVHHVPPAVEMSETRSPSRTPFSRKLATAAFAAFARVGVMWVSSKMIANVRPRCSAGSVFTDTCGGATLDAGGGSSGSSIASKLTTGWATPSSSTVIDSFVRPLIGVPFLSVTTTSTMTCSICAGKLGGCADAAGAAEPVAGGPAGAWAAGAAACVCAAGWAAAGAAACAAARVACAASASRRRGPVCCLMILTRA